MRGIGVGAEGDAQFEAVIEQLAERHGGGLVVGRFVVQVDEVDGGDGLRQGLKALVERVGGVGAVLGQEGFDVVEVAHAPAAHTEAQARDGGGALLEASQQAWPGGIAHVLARLHNGRVVEG